MRRIAFVPDAIDLTFSVVAVRRDWAEANRDTLVRFLAALRDGARWLYAPENRGAAAQLLARYSNLSPAVADGTYEIMVARFGAFTREGEIDRQRFANWFALLAETGELATTSPTVERYVDERYWREALQR